MARPQGATSLRLVIEVLVSGVRNESKAKKSSPLMPVNTWIRPLLAVPLKNLFILMLIEVVNSLSMRNLHVGRDLNVGVDAVGGTEELGATFVRVKSKTDLCSVDV